MNYKEILKQALEASEKALWECVPTPVRFTSVDLEDNPIDGPGEIDLDGQCGGSYIANIDGRDPFVKWAKVHEPDLIRKGVYKGYDIYIPRHKYKKQYRGQSYDRYKASAEAYAKVLNENGIKCSAKSYVD